MKTRNYATTTSLGVDKGEHSVTVIYKSPTLFWNDRRKIKQSKDYVDFLIPYFYENVSNNMPDYYI